MKTKTVFFILLLIVCSHSENITVSMSGEYKTRNQHKMAVFWRLHSVLSPIGICFNGVILYLFVDERKTLIKSVNVMIWWIFHESIVLAHTYAQTFYIMLYLNFSHKFSGLILGWLPSMDCVFLWSQFHGKVTECQQILHIYNNLLGKPSIKKRVKRVTSYKKVGWVGPKNHISIRNEEVTLS